MGGWRKARPATMSLIRRSGGHVEPTATTSAQQTNGAGPATGVLESFNPATGELVGTVPTLTPDQVQSVVDEVGTVQPFGAQLPLSDRARYMRRTAQVIIDSLDEITSLLSREQGKP